jgi:hypothetical protein
LRSSEKDRNRIQRGQIEVLEADLRATRLQLKRDGVKAVEEAAKEVKRGQFKIMNTTAATVTAMDKSTLSSFPFQPVGQGATPYASSHRA